MLTEIEAIKAIELNQTLANAGFLWIDDRVWCELRSFDSVYCDYFLEGKLNASEVVRRYMALVDAMEDLHAL